jgi:hypothetical protein
LGRVYGEGSLVPYIVILSLVFLFINLRDNKYKIAFLSNVILVYTFFSFAATKMVSFCFIVSPIIFISLGSIMENLFAFIKRKLVKRKLIQYPLILIMLLLILFGNLDMHQIAYKHTLLINPNDTDKRIEKINDALFIKSLKKQLITDDYVIFNCKPERDISIMFYTNYIAYRIPLSFENYTNLKNQKIKIAVIDNGKLSNFIKNDSTIVKIKAPDETWMN